jgi:hypothetical protein
VIREEQLSGIYIPKNVGKYLPLRRIKLESGRCSELIWQHSELVAVFGNGASGYFYALFGQSGRYFAI